MQANKRLIKLSKLKLLKDKNQECELFKKYIKEKASSGHQLNILEAGYGRFWPLDMSGI